MPGESQQAPLPVDGPVYSGTPYDVESDPQYRDAVAAARNSCYQSLRTAKDALDQARTPFS